MLGDKKLNAKRKRQKVNILFAVVCLLFTVSLSASALELDLSVDDEIRKNYNPDKIEEDMALPALPKILKENTVQKNKNTGNYHPSGTMKKISNQQIYKNSPASRESYAVFKKGTKIKVKMLNSVSDHSKRGLALSFVSVYPVSTTYFTIPAGTVFKGVLVDAHKPQFGGNGGLIKISINEMILNNQVHPVNAFVTNANFKKVFFNNIKGKRKYLSSMFKSMQPGCSFFKRMAKVSFGLVQDGSSIIIAPFSLAAGVLAAGGNIFVSPALALFYKGDFVHINLNTTLEITLAQDVFIYK